MHSADEPRVKACEIAIVFPCSFSPLSIPLFPLSPLFFFYFASLILSLYVCLFGYSFFPYVEELSLSISIRLFGSLINEIIFFLARCNVVMLLVLMIVVLIADIRVIRMTEIY